MRLNKLSLLPPKSAAVLRETNPQWQPFLQVASDSGQLTLLEGPAGSGKTSALAAAGRLIAKQLAEQAQKQTPGQPTQTTDATFEPLIVLAPTRERADQLTRLLPNMARVLTPVGLAMRLLLAHRRLANNLDLAQQFALVDASEDQEWGESLSAEQVQFVAGGEQEEQIALLVEETARQARQQEGPESVKARWLGKFSQLDASYIREFLDACNQWNVDEEQLVELAEKFEVPEWRYLALLLTHSNPGLGATQFDSSQMLKSAYDLVAGLWEQMHNGDELPRPRWVLVDDLQDYPQVFADLLVKWWELGQREAQKGGEPTTLVATNNPWVSVENFRGANPYNMRSLQATGMCQVFDSGLWREGPRPGEILNPTQLDGTLPQVEIRLSGSEEDQMQAISKYLRKQHQAGVEWDEMALIVRNSGQAQHFSNLLTTKGLNVSAGARPVFFAMNPVTGPLLRTVTAPDYPLGENGEDLLREERLFGGAADGGGMPDVADTASTYTPSADTPDTPSADTPDTLSASAPLSSLLAQMRARAATVRELLCSPLLGLDSADLKRLERAAQIDSIPLFRDRFYARLGTQYARWDLPACSEEVSATLKTAHEMLHTGHKIRSGPPAESLWELWDLARQQHAYQWQLVIDQSLGAWEELPANQQCKALKPLTIQQADFYLDSMISLLRQCDVYQQKHPDHTVSQYADYLLHLEQSLDTLAVLAQKGKYVSCLTPQRAQGRTFKVVVVAGLQQGVWPSQHAADPLRTGALSYVCTHSQAQAEEMLPFLTNMQSLVNERKRLEFYWLAAALSRTSERLMISAVCENKNLQSEFFDLLAKKLNRFDLFDSEGMGKPSEEAPLHVATHTDVNVGYQEIPGQSQVQMPADEPVYGELEVSGLRTLVSYLRHQLVTADEHSPEHYRASATLAFLANNGVSYANPDNWERHGAGVSAEDWYTCDVELYSEEETIFLSPSRIEELEMCSLKYFFHKYGGENVSDDNDSARAGTAIHYVAENFDRANASTRQAEFMKLRPYLDKNWGNQLKYKAEQSAMDNLSVFLDKQVDLPRVKEESFSAPLSPTLTLSGVIDRIVADANGLTIYDFKTGKKAVSAKDATTHRQLQAYQLLVSYALSRNDNKLTELLEVAPQQIAEAVLVYLKPDKLVQQDALDEMEIKSTTDEFVQLSTRLRGRKIPVKRKNADVCALCAFTQICPLKQSEIANEE